MRMDRANRSFAALAGASALLAMLVVCGAAGCVLIALVASRLVSDGPSAFAEAAVWPGLLFIGAVGTGAARGAWSVRRQLQASRALSRRVDDLKLDLPTAIAERARARGLAGRVDLVDSGECFSFAYGALTPRVAVSRGLLRSASEAELDAVLEHEAYHVRNLDPLKVLFSRALPAAFFYLPALGVFHEAYMASRELAADRRAVERCGRGSLAGALFKVVRAPAWPELQAAAAIGGPELLHVRVSQLETGREPRVGNVPGKTLAVSIGAGAALGAAFVLSVVGLGGSSELTQATGSEVGLFDAAGALICALPLVIGGWLGYRWLSHRSQRPLDTTLS